MLCSMLCNTSVAWGQFMSSYKGTNLHHVPESDYSVTVEGLPCTELDVSEDGTAITCLPPQSVSIFGQTSLPVTVSINVLTAGPRQCSTP